VRAFTCSSTFTLRRVLATLTALADLAARGAAVIRKLTAYKIGQAVRDDGPQPTSPRRHADWAARSCCFPS